jgi:hypothetical protein
MREDAPFGDHVGPGVQFDGAFRGQVPPRSLETSRVRSAEIQRVKRGLTRP